jgi:hypothetical protein
MSVKGDTRYGIRDTGYAVRDLASRITHPSSRIALLTLCLLLLAPALFAQPLPLRTQKGDIKIWDEDYLAGPPKGWTAPGDYAAAYGSNRRATEIYNGIRFGRFGLMSGSRLYTSWRPVLPLTDEQYAQGAGAAVVPGACAGSGQRFCEGHPDSDPEGRHPGLGRGLPPGTAQWLDGSGGLPRRFWQ